MDSDELWVDDLSDFDLEPIATTPKQRDLSPVRYTHNAALREDWTPDKSIVPGFQTPPRAPRANRKGFQVQNSPILEFGDLCGGKRGTPTIRKLNLLPDLELEKVVAFG